MELDTIVVGDCLDVMGGMEDNSVNLIVADPPYYKVKHEPWDRQWSDPAAFLAWMGRVLEACHRVLVANGSLYVFASPEMSDRVSVKVREWFEVLNTITWAKPEQSYAEKYGPERFRQYVPMSERIIFAEHYGSDGYAKREAGYTAKCDELRGFVFEPLRAYLDGERQRAGANFEQVRQIVGCAEGSGLPSHWFTRSQWMLPTQKNYEKLRQGFSNLNHGGSYLRREYEDLRREYEDLRREYEDLRRPFNASPERPYTDVWTFKTASSYPGKHPCEKPIDLIEHIIEMSSRPGDVVFDPFMGGGTTAVGALRMGRHFYGCDINPEYVKLANERIEKTRLEMSQMELNLET